MTCRQWQIFIYLKYEIIWFDSYNYGSPTQGGIYIQKKIDYIQQIVNSTSKIGDLVVSLFFLFILLLILPTTRFSFAVFIYFYINVMIGQVIYDYIYHIKMRTLNSN
jgi:hypothetical protein